MLAHLGSRDEQLNRLITTFRTFVGGLKDDRQAILGSLDQISTLSVETASLVEGIRKPFVEDIKHLRAVAENLDRNKGELDRALQVLPIKLEKVGRTADLRLVVQLLPLPVPGQGDRRGRDRPGAVQHRLRQVRTRMTER